MSKLCPYYQTTAEVGSPSVDVIIASKVPAVRVMHLDEYGGNPFPTKETHARVYVYGDEWEAGLARQGADGARQYFGVCRPRYDKLKAMGVTHVSGANELHPQNDAEYVAMDEFQTEWARLCGEYGLHPWVWDWGVGWPDIGKSALWVESVREARKWGGGLCVHLYGAPAVIGNEVYSDAYHSMRVVLQIAELYAAGLEQGDGWVIVGEGGIDGGVIDWNNHPYFMSAPRLGWRDWSDWVYQTPTGPRIMDEALYWEQLSPWDDLLCEIPEVRWVFPFIAHPREKWVTFTINQYLIDKMAAKYETVEEVPVPVPALSLVPPIAMQDLYRISDTFRPSGAGPHFGLDLSVVVGRPVVAPAAGRATRHNQPEGFGLYVMIETATHLIFVCHLSRQMVDDGAMVQAGQTIGLSGNTGNSSGPHVHLEVRAKAGSPFRNGAVDPEPMIKWPPVPADPPDTVAELQRFIGEEMQAFIIPLNSDAALERAAAARGYLPASDEKRLTRDGQIYVCQAFRVADDRLVQWHAYCKDGEWDKITWFPRAN